MPDDNMKSFLNLHKTKTMNRNTSEPQMKRVRRGTISAGDINMKIQKLSAEEVFCSNHVGQTKQMDNMIDQKSNEHSRINRQGRFSKGRNEADLQSSDASG